MPMSESTLNELRKEARSWERTSDRAKLSARLHRGSRQQLFNLNETREEADRNARAIRLVIAIEGADMLIAINDQARAAKR